MPETTTPPAPPVRLRGDALRLVLFGMPAAGKSSLLGALGQAADTQEHLIGGRLLDLSQGLTELRQRLYEESPRRTVDEIVPYPVALEPFSPEERAARGSRIEGVVIDCDGRVANDLLVRRKSLDADSPEGTLTREVVRADSLILVVDASAPPPQVDADFVEFDRFLRLLERGRGQRAEVGGLPVFLVLSKCDLLAEHGDGALEWMDRIEDRKRQVDRRFREFLKRKVEENGPLPFGRIDLRLWATAVKRPALKETPARPREPYGVAELFRQCFTAAEEFRGRRRQSGRLLLGTVLGAIGLVAVLLTFATWVGSRNLRTQTPSELQSKVEIVRSNEGQTASARLEGSRDVLARRLAVLTDLKNAAEFETLPEELRGWVSERIEELQEYDAYYRKLLESRSPGASRHLGELQEIEDALKTTLAVPRDAWSETRAARLRRERLEEVSDLRAAARKVEDWYAQMRERGETLWTLDRRSAPPNGASVDWRHWQGEVKKLLAAADAPPFREGDRLREPDGPTYRETVLRLESTATARADWERVRQRLERLLDLCAALGLAPVSDRPPLLVFSESAPRAPSDLRGRLQDLKKTYPRFEEDFQLAQLPEAALGDIRQAARANHAPLLEPMREVVLRRLQNAAPGEEENAARWDDVRRWLQGSPEELADSRVLARTLRRLQEPTAPDADPVSDLLRFLTQDRYELTLRRLSLRLPRDLGIRPQGNLSVFHGATTTVTLEPFGEPEYDAQTRLTTYTFRVAQESSLTYRPGEILWARLPVRKEGETTTWALSWVRGRSRMYQFEHLTRGAFLHPENQMETEGKYHEEVRLLPGTDSRLPTVPDLIPIVRLKR